MDLRAYRISVAALASLLVATAVAVAAATPTPAPVHATAGAQLQRDTYVSKGSGTGGSDGIRRVTGSLGRLTSTAPAEPSDAYVTVDSAARISVDDTGELRLVASVDGVARPLGVRFPYQGVQAVRPHRSGGEQTVTGAWLLANVPAGARVVVEPRLIVANQHPVRQGTSVVALLGPGTVSIEYARAAG
ncbi:MAG: hypothetical protein JWN72_893 [Thermoleophilia bacterium]|nr:hypothetical protein [Thermoleophilia bacterium]